MQQQQKGMPPSKKKRVSNYKRPPNMQQLSLSPHNNSASYSDYGGRSPALTGTTAVPLGRSPRTNSAHGIASGLHMPSRASPTSVLQYGAGLNSNAHITPSSENKASEWLLCNDNSLESLGRLPGHESPQKSPRSPFIDLAGKKPDIQKIRSYLSDFYT